MSILGGSQEIMQDLGMNISLKFMDNDAKL